MELHAPTLAAHCFVLLLAEQEVNEWEKSLIGLHLAVPRFVYSCFDKKT